MRQLQHALRTLWKSPFVTLIAIASLALGIGANAAVFSVVDQILVRPLPVADPGRLVNFAAPGPNPGNQSCNTTGGCDELFTWSMFQDLQRDQRSFTGIAAHRSFHATLVDAGGAHAGSGSFVSGSYFSVLGLHPALGRLIAAGDDAIPGSSQFAVLSYDYWQRAFNHDPAVLQRTLMVNGHTLSIIGVAPRGYDGTSVGTHPEIYVPMSQLAALWPQISDRVFTDRQFYVLYLFGRLAPGVSIAQAQNSINLPYHAAITAELPLQKILSPARKLEFAAKRIQLSPGSRGQSLIMNRSRTPLYLLLGVTFFVLLIACANIANLFLARGAARAGEMAIRLSIGASRRQVVSQLMLESSVLALFGGIAGLLVARLTLGVIAATLSRDAAGTFAVHLDSTMLLFAAVVTLGTGILFGLFPAIHSTRPDLLSLIRDQAGQSSGGRAATRFRTTLVTTQIALSMALLVSAGLFLKSLVNVTHVDLGIRTDHLVTFGVSPDLAGYPPEQTVALYQRIDAELRTLPGVERVGESLVPLLTTVATWGSDVGVDGFNPGPDEDDNSRFNALSGDYFGATGVKLLAGRPFTASDVQDAPHVAIVNQAFVKKFHLGNHPLGAHMDRNNHKRDIEIVGVMQDAKYNTARGEIEAQFVVPLEQNFYSGTAQFYVRGHGDEAALLRTIPAALARIDPKLPVEHMMTMAQQFDDNIYLDRFTGIMSTAFACLATLLAAIGLYGVLAYTVTQRTREIGLRMAIGATPANVCRLVLRQVGVMAVAGCAAGILVALIIGRIGRTLLFGLSGYDTRVFVSALLVLSVVTLAAGLVPAVRAARIDPMRALRFR